MIGQKEAVWALKPTPAPGMIPGTAYDAANGLGADALARYGGITTDTGIEAKSDSERMMGHILIYDHYFSNGTPLSVARSELLGDDLPNDASLSWSRDLGACRFDQYTSRAVTRSPTS